MGTVRKNIKIAGRTSLDILAPFFVNIQPTTHI